MGSASSSPNPHHGQGQGQGYGYGKTATATTTRAKVSGTEWSDSPHFEAVLERIDEAITVRDRANRLRYANRAAARLFGFSSAAEVFSSRAGEWSEDIQIFDESGTVISFTRTLCDEPERVVRFCRRGAKTRWGVFKRELVRDAAGEVSFAVTIFRDITEARDAVRWRENLLAIVKPTIEEPAHLDPGQHRLCAQADGARVTEWAHPQDARERAPLRSSHAPLDSQRPRCGVLESGHLPMDEQPTRPSS